MHKQAQGSRFLRQIVMALVALSFTTLAMAQGKGAAAVAMYSVAAKEQTNVAGVSIVVDRPAGFNPLTASNEDLGKYGLPLRPDAQADPKGFSHWTRGMMALQYRAAAQVQAMPYSSKNMVLASNQPATQTISAKPTQYLSLNWSGVANTNKRTTWSDTYSFDYVESIWNVPAAQAPFKACANGIGGAKGRPGFYEASWNGIDGFSNGDVVQGGSLSLADCHGSVDNEYLGWVEWYPSYPILVIECQIKKAIVPCPVNAGDDFLVETYASNSTTQFVYVEDVTQGWYGTFGLAYITGPAVVGSSEEQIVERPCCDKNGYPLALANYIADFFDYAHGFNGAGQEFYPGLDSPQTAVIDMVDDNDTQAISIVEQGTQGFQGMYSLFFETTNCAYQGGCASD